MDQQKIDAYNQKRQDEYKHNQVLQSLHDLLLATVVSKDPRLHDVAKNLGDFLQQIADATENFNGSALQLLPLANQELAESVKELALKVEDLKPQDLAPQFDKLAKKLNQKPIVNLPEPKLDTKPLEKLIAEVKQALIDNKIDIPETDLKKVEDGLKSVRDAVTGLRFPVSNYVLPFRDYVGKDTQAQLDSEGKLPVSVTGLTLEASDIEIGAVEIKDGSSDNRASVSSAGELKVLDSNSAAVAASLSVVDDWDESDRAKVNLIVGQAGIAGGTGVDGATVPRVTLATNVGLPAGSSILGKVGIDQTTPGTTNLVALTPETTKVIGVTRTADGSGNLLTTNSTTYTAKFALDGNLLGTLGTAFSTAGKIDVKAADGDIFVRQATAANLNATVVGNIASGSADSGNPVKVGGVYNSTPPTLTNGQRGDIQLDTRGGLQIVVTDKDGTGGAVVGSQGTNIVTNVNGLQTRSTMYGQFDDVSPGALTEDRLGIPRMSANRNSYITIRDAAGNERGANVDANSNLQVGQATASNLNMTEASAASILTSAQLIDDMIHTDDTSTHATGTSKGALIMGAATPTDTAVNTNDIGAVGMTNNRELYVSLRDIAGASAVTGSGNATGALRVEIANNGTGLVGLNAGTNGIGKLTANSGVDIGDVDVTSVVAGTGATNLGKAEDAGHSSGDTGVYNLGVRNDTPNTALTNTDADYASLTTDRVGGIRTALYETDFAVLGTNHVKKYYTSTGAVTDGIVWSPAAGKRWYVTDIFINVSAAATVTLEDDKAGGDEAVWKAELAANSGWSHSFATPLFSGEDAADLLITTNTGNVYVCITGYEI